MEDNLKKFSCSYKELEELYPNTIILRLRGSFYDAYGNSALVLGEITGYKVKKQSDKAMFKAGFPSNALEKNLQVMRDSNISYIVFERDEKIFEEKFSNNRFQETLNVANRLLNSCHVSEENDSVVDVNANDFIRVTFNCPKKIHDEIKEMYSEYSNWVFNPESFDFLLTMLIKKGIDVMNK